MFRDRTGSFRRPGIGGRVLAIAVGGLLAVVVLVVGAGLLWLRTSVPALDGRLEGLPGLTGQAAISRDSRGVVYITAETTADASRSEEHTYELQSPMRISYAVFCLKKKKLEYTITARLTR